MKLRLFLFALLAINSNHLFAEQAKGITVVGKASIAKAPDQFKVVFTLEQRTAIIAKAKAKIDQQTNLLTRAAKAMRIKDDDIKTTSVQVVPIYPKPNTNLHRVYVEQDFNQSDGVVALNGNAESKVKARPDRAEIVFDLRRQVEVILTDVDDYERLLDKALKIGVTRISPVQSSLAKAETLYQQALTQAVANAKTKALRLAENLGVELGPVQMLNEHAYRAPGQVMMAAEAFDGARQMKSYSGTSEISAEVTVTFMLKSN
ncbi:SIMPL domain-containing protein [Thalassotalea montiporae]